MGNIHFDDTRFPLVVVTFEGATSDAQFDGYLDKMSMLLDRRQRNVTVLDARRSESPPAKQRAKQAEWMKANRDRLRQYSCGTAFVIQSAVIRGALTAILWITPMPVPHVVVATVEEAERWAVRQLETARSATV